MSTVSEASSPPELPAESVGSSVSTSLQKEYEELLRYAVVTPKVTVPRAERVEKLPQYSTTSTETSSESYEAETKDLRKEVYGLPSTPLGTQKAVVEDNDHKAFTPSNENSPGDEVSDSSFASNQSAAPGKMNMPGTVSPSVDADLVRMETQLDSWCMDMKRNILAEFAQCKMSLFERHRLALKAEKQRHAAEMNKRLNELESLKELLFTYEKTMEHKDHIIGNMTKAIQKQKERFDLLRRFTTWKIKHVEEKKESKAQDVCVKLTDEYESKLQEANKALEEARLEVGRLHAEREIYEETMKKAFMRGVCALNLEAMHMFREPGEDDRVSGEVGEPRDDEGSTDSGNEMNPRTHPPKPITSSGVISNRRIPNLQQSSMQNKTSSGGNIPTSTGAAGNTARIVNVRAVGRADFRSGGNSSSGGGLPGASTVSSVLVQRHSGPDAVHSKTIRNTQPSQNAPKISSGKVKPSTSTIRTSHVPPVKVVH